MSVKPEYDYKTSDEIPDYVYYTKFDKTRIVILAKDGQLARIFYRYSVAAQPGEPVLMPLKIYIPSVTIGPKRESSTKKANKHYLVDAYTTLSDDFAQVISTVESVMSSKSRRLNWRHRFSPFLKECSNTGRTNRHGNYMSVLKIHAGKYEIFMDGERIYENHVVSLSDLDKFQEADIILEFPNVYFYRGYYGLSIYARYIDINVDE